MKKKSYSTTLVNSCLLLAGIIFLCYFKNENVLAIVAQILGLVFIIPSLVYLCLVGINHNDKRDSTDLLGIFPAVGGLCFGIVLLLRPELFYSVIGYVFSIILTALGLFHIIYMLMSRKSMTLRAWYYALPVAITAAGLLTMFKFNGSEYRQLLVLLTGISLILAALTALLEALAQRKAACHSGASTCQDATQDTSATVKNDAANE